MNVVVEITGRKALPVWTIPYALDGWISPDKLLAMLADPTNESGIYKHFPTTFNLDRDGSPLPPLPPGQWAELAIQIGKLSHSLKDKKLPEDEDRQEWRKQSIGLLMPYHAYIWLDELQEWVAKCHNYFDSVSFGIQEADNSHIAICLNPLIPNDHEAFFENIESNRLNQKVSDKVAKDLQKNIENLHNGKAIDWGYWVGLSNISPEQAAKLVHHIDPILWADNNFAADQPYDGRYKGERILDGTLVNIRKLEQELSNRSSTWTLINLVDFVGKGNVPYGMAGVIKEQID